MSMTLWQASKQVKKETGIRRGEQHYYKDGVRVPMRTYISEPTDMMLIACRIECAGCGQMEGKVKYLLCSGCLDVHYCGDECQKKHWKDHKSSCVVNCRHNYEKKFPDCLRDNGEYDFVCKNCGHVM